LGGEEEESWADRVGAFLPGFAERIELLAPLRGRWSVLLHGSTSAGVDDDVSDLDVWALVPAGAFADVDRRSPTRVFPFQLAGKRGHLNVEDEAGFRDRVTRCDIPLIAELRLARVLEDDLGVGAALVAAARHPIPDDIRHAWFRYHYVEMRGSHRTADNAALRTEPMAVLLTTTPAVAEALRAAMILDREPYPYPKWLPSRAAACPTGSLVAAAGARFLGVLEAGGLRAPDLDGEGTLGEALREMRGILVERARSDGVDGDWLERWWFYIDEAREGVRDCRWPGATW
jgi:hypothetical protein